MQRGMTFACNKQKTVSRHTRNGEEIEGDAACELMEGDGNKLEKAPAFVPNDLFMDVQNIVVDKKLHDLKVQMTAPFWAGKERSLGIEYFVKPTKDSASIKSQLGTSDPLFFHERQQLMKGIKPGVLTEKILSLKGLGATKEIGKHRRNKKALKEGKCDSIIKLQHSGLEMYDSLVGV